MLNELSEMELDLIAAGADLNLNLGHLVNLNIGVNLQNGQNIAVLSVGAIQNIIQSIGQVQVA